MAGKAAPWTDADEQQLQKLMAQKQAAAKTKLTPAVPPLPSRGGMSDASKRRLEVDSNDDDFSLVDGQEPFVPEGWMTQELAMGSQDPDEKVRHLLPEGVSGFHEWGRTVIDFGKLRGSNTSYIEAVQNKDLKSYMDWRRSHLSPTSKTSKGPSADFAAYLTAYELVYSATEAHGCYARTITRRVLK